MTATDRRSSASHPRNDNERAASIQERPDFMGQAKSFQSERRRRRAAGWAACFARLLMMLLAGRLADSLRFTSIQMPALVQRGTNFWLSCQYELGASSGSTRGKLSAGADEQLYSVKWYRNNEEFYRLIFGGASGQQQQQQHKQSHVDQLGAAQPSQQQYFTQAGVNVLMSSSNATHVRLLNASLESDGSYACEISTQNLSTIRHEKEIKVYVLPHLKLNLIGLKSLYSLGDRVELNCLSDFSRPAGALGWFINGQQIKEQTTNAQHFELAASTRHKSGEPKLTRSSLTLKFRLTSGLLGAFGGGGGGASRPLDASKRRGNQSGLLLMKTHGGRAHQTGQTAALLSSRDFQASGDDVRLHELLKLECRYKLTEVTDVTFNELRVSSAVAPSSPSARADETSGQLQAGSERARLADEFRRRRRRALRASDRRDFTLAKSNAGSQVTQSSCPARRAELALLAAAAHSARSHQPGAACQLGLLALQRDDPVILEPEVEGSSETDLEQAEDAEQEERAQVEREEPLELPVGFTLRVNCSTLGVAMAWAQERAWPAASSSGAQRSSALDHNERVKKQQQQGEDERRQSAHESVYCSDLATRKRLLVSGRSATAIAPAEQEAPHSRSNPSSAMIGQQQQAHQQRRYHVAYVDVAPAATTTTTRRPQREAAAAAPDDKLSLSAPAPATDPWGALATTRAQKSLGQLQRAAASKEEEEEEREGAIREDETAIVMAPPLLEWFINNQEAPRSSASYTPELPLVSAHASSPVRSRDDSGAQQSFDSRPLGGGASSQGPAEPPSIDYVEYFANFNQRPIDQHLMLQLTLDKTHFMTPDSLLKLRCTSTQAQVLAADSLTVGLTALPAGNWHHLARENQLERTNQQQQVQSSWQQKTPSAGSEGAQIKSKYLHQYPRSSSQRNRGLLAQGIAGHPARGANQQASQSSASEGNGTSGRSSRVSCTLGALFTSIAILMVHRRAAPLHV